MQVFCWCNDEEDTKTPLSTPEVLLGTPTASILKKTVPVQPNEEADYTDSSPTLPTEGESDVQRPASKVRFCEGPELRRGAYMIKEGSPYKPESGLVGIPKHNSTYEGTSTLLRKGRPTLEGAALQENILRKKCFSTRAGYEDFHRQPEPESTETVADSDSYADDEEVCDVVGTVGVAC